MIKKIINLLIVYCLIFASTVGCGKKVESDIFKVEFGNIPRAVQNFVDRNSVKNGIYLYSDITIDDYLFLNEFNIYQGEKAAFFKNIKFSPEEKILNIYIDKEFSEDYSKKLNNKVIYRIKSSNRFDAIKVFVDGKEIPFDGVGT